MAFWRRRFNSDPKIIGKAINLSGRDFTVIGVLPSNYESLIATDMRASGVEIWERLGTCDTAGCLSELSTSKSDRRLRPGVTVAQQVRK